MSKAISRRDFLKVSGAVPAGRLRRLRQRWFYRHFHRCFFRSRFRGRPVF